MNGLRFAMLTTFYPPHNFGGDGIAVQRLARGLVRRGHQVTVIHDVDAYNALHAGPAPALPDRADGVDVIGLNSRLGPLSPLLTQQTGQPVLNGDRIRALLDERQVDVTMFHNISLIGGPGLLRAGRGIRLYEAHEHWLVCPSHVLWRHGRETCTGRQCVRCVLHYRRPPQLWRYTGKLERELKHVDAIIAKSEFSRQKHREFGLTRDMDVIPYFLPDEAVNDPDSARAPRSARERPYFLFVGRLERIKGLDDVIPAFRNVADADLLIAGDGEHGDVLRGLAAGMENVRFLGRIPLDELKALYRGAVALIVPSVCFETFGIILIEAFQQGTPVIARRIGPFPEIVDASSGGLLFESTDEMLGAMRRMMAEPELRGRLASAGRKAYEERWSESAVVPQYLELVRREAERKGESRTVETLMTASVA